MPVEDECRIVPKAASTQLGWRRRGMAMVVTLIGLATFITPLVETDSEVLGRTRWSPLQIVAALHAGTLPLVRDMPRVQAVYLGIDLLSGVGVAYLVLGLIAIAIVWWPSVRFIASAAAVGVAAALSDCKFDYGDFQGAIYGAPSAFAGHQVHAGINCLVLVGTLGLLGWIALTKQLE